ncbi:MAG: hypothetical protein JW937_00510 [Candidatus Omnitrophica bacterium]|nr:hypothetical protein [Candidatus Omnitrophota bacterium]
MKKDLLTILNQANEWEHAASMKYFSRAEIITETLIEIEGTHGFKGGKDIEKVDLRNETEAIAFYRMIRNKSRLYGAQFHRVLQRLEEEIKNVVQDEQAHAQQLLEVIGRLEERVEMERRTTRSPRASNA